MHFLFSCKLYDDLRLNFFSEIADKYCILNEFDINGKSLFLSKNIDPHGMSINRCFCLQSYDS